MSAQDLAAVIAIAQEGGRLVTEMRRGELGVQTLSLIHISEPTRPY